MMDSLGYSEGSINIAQKFGKATQPPENNYRYYYPPQNAIDANLSTFNHTEDGATLNWWQLELPNPTQVTKIIIHNRISNSQLLEGAKLYLTEQDFNGTITSSPIATLTGELTETLLFNTPLNGRYLLIKAQGDNNLHMAEVEVYGMLPQNPVFQNEITTISIDKWRNTITPIFNGDAIDYQADLISYSIDNENKFRIDNQGNLYVNAPLNIEDYTLTLIASDGENHQNKTIIVKVIEKPIVEEQYRTNDSRPLLTGYLPNTYNIGDSVDILINGESYTPTIQSNGEWTISSNTISPKLPIGEYNLTIVLNNNLAINYENYFEIYGKNIYRQNLNISEFGNIEDIQITINSSTTAPLAKEKVVNATSIWLENNNSNTILVNDSYRTLNSLIATYTDSSNQKHFLRLIFDKDIEPYSRSVINFANENNATIFHTAGTYNLNISFGGADCNQATNDTTIYCTPTTRNDTIYSDTANKNSNISEQQVFSRVTATWNHLYNRVDGIKSIDAYIHQTTYKDMDYSDAYQGSDEYATGDNKENFFYERFFASLSPNNYTEFKAMRYYYNAEGRAGQPSNYSTTGEQNIGSWASLWEGSLWVQGLNGDIVYGAYEYIHHEMMHSHGMGHESGLTYGWPHHASKLFIKNRYIGGKIPIVKAPKYIFNIKPLTKNSLEIELYKTSDANDQELTFEIFSGKAALLNDFVFEELSQNRIKLSIKEEVFPRFFLRVYGEESDELMSQLITPDIMYDELLIKQHDNDNNKSYLILSHNAWQEIADKTANSSVVYDSDKICRIFTNSKGIKATKLETEATIIRNSLAKQTKFPNTTEYYAGAGYDYWKVLSYSTLGEISLRDILFWQNDWKDDTIHNPNASELGLMCVKPLK